MSTYSDALKARMQRHGVSVEHLTMQTHIAKTKLYEYLSGDVEPQPKTMQKIFRAINDMKEGYQE